MPIVVLGTFDLGEFENAGEGSSSAEPDGSKRSNNAKIYRTNEGDTEETFSVTDDPGWCMRNSGLAAFEFVRSKTNISRKFRALNYAPEAISH
jgi:hypothetical protein